MRVSIYRDWEVDLHWPRKPPGEVFVRFGLFSLYRPQSGNSHTGEDEIGLSVYRGRLTEGLVIELAKGEYIPPVYKEELEGRLVFGLAGRVVGIGSDGEPVIKGVRVLPYPLGLTIRKQVLP